MKRGYLHIAVGSITRGLMLGSERRFSIWKVATYCRCPTPQMPYADTHIYMPVGVVPNCNGGAVASHVGGNQELKDPFSTVHAIRAENCYPLNAAEIILRLSTPTSDIQVAF